MEGIKYVNLIEIGPVVIEIRGDENGELAVPVNNTLVSHTAFLAADTKLVSHTAFLAADTQPCVLIFIYFVLFCYHMAMLYGNLKFCLKVTFITKLNNSVTAGVV